jgi:hypothetical protein
MDYCAFTAPPFVQALIGFPWRAPAHPPVPGMPFGINLRDASPFEIDLWLYKKFGIVPSLSVRVIGVKESGKTTLARVLVVRMSLISAGKGYLTVWINTRKTDDGEEEYFGLGEFFECHDINFWAHPFDPFDQSIGFSPATLLGIAIDFVETMAHRRLKDQEPLALQVAMFRMLRDWKHSVRLEMLESITRRLNETDMQAYFTDTDNPLRKSLEEEILAIKDRKEREDKMAQLQAHFKKPSKFDLYKFEEGRANINSFLLSLMRGEFEGVFGGKGNLRRDLTQQVVKFNYIGLPDDAVTLIQSVLSRIHTHAAVTNDSTLQPGLEIDDEDHEALKNVAYVRNKSEKIKKIRGTGTALVGISQNFSDYATVGDEGSEQRNKAMGMLLGDDITFIGRVPPKEIAIIKELHPHLSSMDLKALTALPVRKGIFMALFAKRPAEVFRLLLTKKEAELSRSNKAIDRMVDERPILHEWLQWNGDGTIQVNDEAFSWPQPVRQIPPPAREEDLDRR